MKQYDNKLDITKAVVNSEEVITKLKQKFKTQGDISAPCSGYWLLTDGTLLNCGAHGGIDNFLIKEGYIINLSDHFTVYDGSQFMDYINAIRIRNEVPHLHYPAYLTLPENNLTSQQWIKVRQWLQKALTYCKTYLIVDCGGFTKEYHNFEDEDAIEDIQMWYRTKNL